MSYLTTRVPLFVETLVQETRSNFIKLHRSTVFNEQECHCQIRLAKNLRVLVNIWHIFTIFRGFISYDEFLAKGEAIDKDVLQKARANVSIDDVAALFVSSVSHKLSKQSQ